MGEQYLLSDFQQVKLPYLVSIAYDDKHCQCNALPNMAMQQYNYYTILCGKSLVENIGS